MRPLLPCREEPRLKEMHCLLYLGEESVLVGCQTGMITTVDLTRASVTSEVGSCRCSRLWVMYPLPLTTDQH